MLANATRPVANRLLLRVISWEIVPQGVVASAQPGETPWRAVLAMENTDTGDGRFINSNALTWRDLPLTLSYQDTIPDGYNPHAGAVAAGRIETIQRLGNIIAGEGVFSADEPGVAAAEAVRTQTVRGVSVDLDMISSEYNLEVDNETGDIISERLVLVEGRIMGAIVTPYPAFAEALIDVSGDTVPAEPVAASATGPDRVPPARYFTDPDLDTLTPLTRAEPDADGWVRVFGHIAPRTQCHVGYPRSCETPPDSRSGYSFFHTGQLDTDAGRINVGRLTFGGLHANPAGITWREAQRHYEDVCTVGADVCAGADGFGVWVSGVMRDNLTDEQWRMFSNASPSGDWRDVRQDGTLELIGVHQVATGGFPVPRTLVASAVMEAGQVVALIAAGVPQGGIHCTEETMELHVDAGAFAALLARVDTLEAENARLSAVVGAVARWGSVSIPDSL